MPIPNYKGLSPEQIISAKYLNDSAWHIWACLAWLDYSKRKNAPIALHYAGFHLRTGIEQLWFEVLFAAKGGSISSVEYKESLRATTTLYKLIDGKAPDYQKYAEFVRLVASVDSRPHPPTIIWDIAKLRRIHGGCSEFLLHFQGIIEEGYLQGEWIAGRTEFLLEAASWIWTRMTETGNLVVFAPEGLKKPEVYSLWERFRDGKNSEEDLINGLRIVQPIVSSRPQNPRH